MVLDTSARSYRVAYSSGKIVTVESTTSTSGGQGPMPSLDRCIESVLRRLVLSPSISSDLYDVSIDIYWSR